MNHVGGHTGSWSIAPSVIQMRCATYANETQPKSTASFPFTHLQLSAHLNLLNIDGSDT